GRWVPYRQASPPLARHRPGARSARREAAVILSQTAKETTMWLKTYFRFLTETSARRRSNRGGSPATRLRIEPLEDRCLLSFGMPVDYGSNLSPLTLMAADFTGDGRADLAAVEYSGTASVLLSNGDGTFQAPRNLGTGVGLLAAADLNSDGKADLVTTPGWSA